MPIGGAAKMVSLLVTLDSLPLPADGGGPAIPIGPEDYTDYLRYSGEGSRATPVSPGDTWSERDVVRAVLLASSNNHADTLVRWAFGGVDPYVEAANAWLAEQGFTATRVADATGLSGDNVGTAEELARLAAMVLADPELAEMLDDPGAAPVGARNVPDLVGRDVDGDARAITRSFTDQAALSYVFTAELPAAEGVEGGPRRITGAMLLMPDYETLDPAVAAAVGSAAAASAPVTVIAEGTPLRPGRGAVGRSCRPGRVDEPSGCRVGQRIRRGDRLGRRVLDRARGSRGGSRQRAHRRRARSPRPCGSRATSGIRVRSGG